MDGENNGKAYEQIHDLGGPPLFLVQHPYQKGLLDLNLHVGPKDHGLDLPPGPRMPVVLIKDMQIPWIYLPIQDG